jgi:hypothetical protein
MTAQDLDALRAHFNDVAHMVGVQISAESPHVVALVAKWPSEDLVPGLSDMDFRIICDETTTSEDWVNIDRQIGRIHCKMVAEHPEWNRINEHTAGAGVSLAEIANDRFHHPEYAVWTVWWGRDEWAKELQARTLARPLDGNDERYHLARFVSYFSPYNHGIDPPINLGVFEPKYALHSRCWHYFAPPMLSAATLLARRHFGGKRPALEWLAENGFAARQARAVLDQVNAHYDTPEQFDPRRLAMFEQFIFAAFEEVFIPLLNSMQSFEVPRPVTLQELKLHLASHLADPLVELLTQVRYARIRAGRYFFYLNAPSHFSAERQLLVEHSWTRQLFKYIFTSLRELQAKNDLSTIGCVSDLGIKLSSSELKALRSMEHLVNMESTDRALPIEYAKAIEWYPDFYLPIEHACQKLLQRERTRTEYQYTMQK